MANPPGNLNRCKIKRINFITGIHTLQEDPRKDANEDGATEMT